MYPVPAGILSDLPERFLRGINPKPTQKVK
jgi:hypothetical protein